MWKPDTLTKTVWEQTEGHCWYCGMLTQLTDDRRVQFLAHAKGYRDNGEYLIIYPRQGEPSINHEAGPVKSEAACATSETHR